MNSTELNRIKAWIKLISTAEIGNSKAIKLAQMLGEPEEFMGSASGKLKDISFISEFAKEQLSQELPPQKWEYTANLIEKYKIKFISILDEKYPPLLKNIFDPPPFLFYRGTLFKEDFRRTFAIVGTRKASNYGKLMTKRIGSKLAESGFTIVSGLAYGIDTISHISALESNKRTFAIMGTGVDQIYPSRNIYLADKIIENGALISEFIPGSKAERWNFPTRNRIISGVSIGCLIVEGSKRSGALLTAKFALDQNRDIFALPGDINRQQAEGPNYLIKLGAKIVTSTKDILEEYDLIMDKDERKIPKLGEKEDQIYNIILQNKPEIQFDNLIMKTGCSVGELSTILLSLELKNIVKKMPGNKIMPLY